MRMKGFNWIVAACLVLALSSGLARAERITSVTPSHVHPGQVVTLHGQFTVANFRSRQYRVFLAKEFAPRPQGAINGVVESFRETPSSVMVRIPRTWHGKPVTPGEYVVYLRDSISNRFIRTGTNAPLILITSSARTAQEAVRNTIGSQIHGRQQKRLGGNIGRAASPGTPFGRGTLGAGIASGAPQMKLEVPSLKVNGREVRGNGVSIGDNVAATFSIQNLGTAPGQVRVGYMSSGLTNASVTRFSRAVTVAPGQTVSVSMDVRIKPRGRNNMNVHHHAWAPVFRLLNTGNQPYRDSYMADNAVAIATGSIPLKAKIDLAVVSIEGVRLAETWHGPSEILGVMHPVSLEFVVKVRNNGIQTSRPTRMAVAVRGVRPADTPMLHEPGRDLRTGNSGQRMEKDVYIAAIPAGQTGSFRVQFTNIPYLIVSSKHHPGRVAVGQYICHRPGNHVSGSTASITAHLMQADVDEAPSFRANNYLKLTGDFGYGDTCGMSQYSRTSRDRSR